MLAKNQLERTVKDLANEVETLSLSNSQLVKLLNTKTFFKKYHDVLEECNQLRLEQEALIDYRFGNLKSEVLHSSVNKYAMDEGRKRSKTLANNDNPMFKRKIGTDFYKTNLCLGNTLKESYMKRSPSNKSYKNIPDVRF